MLKYISPELTAEIKEKAILIDVITNDIELKPKGASFIGDCPSCNGKKKLTVTPSKEIWKCFRCEIGGKDAVSFLMETQSKTYMEALFVLADMYNISLDDTSKKKKRKARKMKFRDLQLRESGILVKAQKYWLSKKGDKENKTKYEMDRYQAASIDKNWSVIPGDDMVLHYLDLEGHPLTFKNRKGKTVPLLRVRWANPSLHKDKYGDPVKYKSPYKSGSHIWLPQFIIEAYQKATILDTLYICEGEKKADKMCLEGLPAVGIMGINNFARDGAMPYHFEMLIKTCSIANIVFILDSDWQDISIKNFQKPVDQRPLIFFKAVLKFKEYFRAYYNEGIELELFFAYGKNEAYKGIDDLLVRELKGKEVELQNDFKLTLLSRTGEGEYINAHKITELSSYKIKEYWNLHSRPKFFSKHQEILKKVKEFTFGQVRWRWNEEGEEFELAQKILQHEQYWRKIHDGEDKAGYDKWKFQFNYVSIYEFLRNRGFGLYEYAKDQFRFVQVNGKVIKETTPHKIQRFVIDFTRDIDELPVLELLFRGGKQYLGPDKLNNMYYFHPEFNQSDKTCQYLYFKNCFWKITEDEIIQRPLSELPRHIWENKIIDFEPVYNGKPMIEIKRNGEDWQFKASKKMQTCEIAQFFSRSSSFHWQKEQELKRVNKETSKWVERKVKEPILEEDLQLWRSNLISKIIATGYELHEYRDYGNLKAVVCMDGIESEVGKSQGGTGKSVWAKQFQYLVPQEIIDGKKKNIEDDNHLYENVDERTQIILFDDVRVNFNFEFLFSQITTGIVVNPKGEKRTKLQPPKFILTTNHALNGNGNSFLRRQHIISFSDYYNKFRSVGDDFGHQLFYEWEHEQWNLFYNWMATCIQTYLKFGLSSSVSQDALEKRKLRQQIGENFMDWATLHYGEDGIFLNDKVEKVFATHRYLKDYEQDRKFINPRKFKEKLILFAQYSGLEFNPISEGERIKSNGKEYFILADETFDANNYVTLQTDDDIRNNILPFNRKL